MAMPDAWIATRKGLFLLDDAGALDGTPSFFGVAVTNALFDQRDGRLYAAVNHGHFGVKLHVSSDRGGQWDELPAPAYPSNPGAPVSTELIWTLSAGGADQPGRLWAGTLPGGLFRSDDSGQTWTLIEALWQERTHWSGGGYDHPGIHSICVDPRNSRRIAVAVSTGGVWLSEDDGQSWQPRTDGLRAAYMPPEQASVPAAQDPHRMIQCQNMPHLFWMQHHNAIFRSEDDLQSWQEIQAPVSQFGFALAVDPHNGHAAWFVPMQSDEYRCPKDGQMVVTHTRDGGQQFEVLRAGLPAPAYDLVYRHGLAIDASGTRLLMGSTTGGLWRSIDRGQSWTLLSAHLPPIYAVGFFV